MSDNDDDLEAEFAEFEAQIQSVVSKPIPTHTTAPAPAPAPAPAAAPSPPAPHRHSAPFRTPTPTVHSAPESEPVRQAPAAGKWKWDGSKWNWVLTSAAASALPSSRPSASAVASLSIPFGPALPSIAAPSASAAPPSLPAAPAPAAPKRSAAGAVWRDPTLAEWPANDHRIFVGDLAPDATDEELRTAFSRYPSFNMARVVKDKHSDQCKGYGFVSFAAGEDMIAALKEMNGKYVGSRPVKLKKSNWEKRNLDGAKRKELKLLQNIVMKKKKRR